MFTMLRFTQYLMKIQFMMLVFMVVYQHFISFLILFKYLDHIVCSFLIYFINLQLIINELLVLNQSIKSMSKPILTVITGNINKLKQFKQILGNSYQIISQNTDCNLQGTPEQIVQHKVLSSYKLFNKAVIVEDTSLCFNAFNGMPGPYIKWFLKAVGPQGLVKMLDSFENKSAQAVCAIGIMSRNLQKPKIFIGKTQGLIVNPRGKTQFGWDPIFQPVGFFKTYAQMTKEQKNKISHRSKAVNQLVQYLQSLTNQEKSSFL